MRSVSDACKKKKEKRRRRRTQHKASADPCRHFVVRKEEWAEVIY